MNGLAHGITYVVLLANTVCVLGIVCEPVNGANHRTDCETKYNIRRHTVIAGLRTKEQVDELCRVYPQYEECLNKLVEECPEDQSFLDLNGYDKNSTLVTFRGFCSDRQVYLSGVPCYEDNYQAILTCFGTHSDLRDSAMAEVNRTDDWEKFYRTLCPLQVEGAQCITASTSNCKSDVSKMMKNIAYSLMHGRCKTPQYGGVLSEYDIEFGKSFTVPLTSSSLTFVAVTTIITLLHG